MKKKYLILAFFVLVSGVLIFDFFYLNKLKNRSGEEEISPQAKKDAVLENVKNAVILPVYFNEAFDLKNVSVFYNNDTVHSFKLFDLVNNDKPILVYRFSALSCELCIDFGLGKLKEHFKDYVTNNRIAIIISENSPRLSSNFYGKKIINITADYLGIPLEKENIPFFVIVDKAKISKLLFVPDKTMPELTDAYLKVIKERFFK